MADLLYKAVIEKLTGEQFNEVFDFEGTIPENTTVTYREVTATKLDGTDATSAVIISSSVSSDQVTVTINTGSEETGYIILVSVHASDTTPGAMVKLLNVTVPGAYR